jgi:hypothetical protein
MLRVSPDLVADLSRALWVAARLNRREGNAPPKPEASQHEALARIVREWSLDALQSLQSGDLPALAALERQGWVCACGASALGEGGLQGGRCRKCAPPPLLGAGLAG